MPEVPTRWLRAGALAVGVLVPLVGAVPTAASAQRVPTARGEREPRGALDETEIAERAMKRLPAGSVRLPSPGSRPPQLEPLRPARRPAFAREADEEAEGNEGTMVKVPLALEGADSARAGFKVSGGQGQILEDEPSGPALALPEGGHAVIASKDSGSIAARSEIRPDQRTPLPWLVVESERTARGVEVRSARPFLTLARAIRWDEESRHHVAEFMFGLEAESSPPHALSHPMAARFTVSCDDVRPEQTELSAVGPRGYRAVQVACSREVKNQRDEHFLEVHAERGSLRYPFAIPRRPGPPRLAAVGGRRVPGFGFGQAEVVVRRVEQDGSPLPAERDLQVHFTARHGHFDVPKAVMRKGESTVRARLHPRGSNDIELTASLEGRRSAPLDLAVTWPLLPLCAMLAGGTLGGFVSALRRDARRKRRRRTLEGALVGVIVAALAIVLPVVSALPGWARTSELGLFVLAGVAGFAGTPLLDRAAGAVFPGLKERRGAQGA